MVNHRLLAIAVLAPMILSCASGSAMHGWWMPEASNTVTINGETKTFSSGWFLRPKYFGACGLRVGRFQGQITGLRLHKGSYRNSVLTLSRGEIVQGNYSDEYFRNPERFFIEGERLRMETLVLGETEPRTSYLVRSPPPSDGAVLAAAARCE